MLVAATSADIAALADRTAALPVAPDLAAPAVLAMLAELAATIAPTFAPAAWLVVEAGIIVGLVSLVAVPADGAIAIGYGVAPACRGAGVARRAVADLLGAAAADPRVTAVTAETATDNRSSQRVLEANGFRRTGARIDPEDGPVIGWRRDLRR